MTTAWSKLHRMGKVHTITVVCLCLARSADAGSMGDGNAGDRRALVGCCIINDIPAPECVPAIEEADCLALGGVAIADVTCDGAPCELGACCLEDAVCNDNLSAGITYPDCVSLLGGTYYGGLRCEPDAPCTVCPLDMAADCQDNTGSYGVPISMQRWADNFTAAADGSITRVCWWPIYRDPLGGMPCQEPDLPPDDFIVRWYADAGGIPGIEIGPPGGEALIRDARITTDTLPGGYLYSAPVTTPPPVTAGECYWIEISAFGSPECHVYWHTNNDDGDGYSVTDDGGWQITLDIGGENPDLAFCVDVGMQHPGCGFFSAACCYPDDTCADDVMVLDCVAAGGIFRPGATCADSPCPPTCVNHDCLTAFDLNATECSAGLPCTFPFSNLDCEVRPGDVLCTPNPGGIPTVINMGSAKWYTWRPQTGEAGPVEVTMCDQAAYDAMLSVYDGGTDCSTCPPDFGTPLACGDDTCGIGGGPPTVTFNAVQGNCYFLRVGGWNGEQGTGQVSILPPPPARPMPDARFGIADGTDTTRSCATDDDCLAGLAASTEVSCIAPPAGDTGDGICYVNTNRYLSIDANPANAGIPSARRVSLGTAALAECTCDYECVPNGVFNFVDLQCMAACFGQTPDTPGCEYADFNCDGLIDLADYDPKDLSAGVLGCRVDGGSPAECCTVVPTPLGWMDAPVAKEVTGPESSPQWLSRIVDDPVYLDWAALGSAHLGDCEVSPGHTYIIQSLREDGNPSNPADYSEPLELSTLTYFGDVTGSSAGDPPDTLRTLKDISAVVRGFQSAQREPKAWLDLQGPLATPDTPDFSDISFTDINHAVAGFQGGAYPFPDPCDCPNQACP